MVFLFYAVLGMQLFADASVPEDIAHLSFHNIANAMLTLLM